MRAFFLWATLVFGFCPDSRAQDSALLDVKAFPEAALMLTTGIMLRGPLRLYPEAEFVSITCANDSIYTLPARLVQWFTVKEPLLTQQPARETYLSAERVFRVFLLATTDNSHLTNWGFYEQLSQGPGPVLLLRREHLLPYELAIARSPFGAGSLPNAPTEPIVIPIYSASNYQTALYLRTAAGTIVRLRKPQHLPNQAPLLRAYARENKLHYANLRDLSFLVNYANSLAETSH